MTAAQNIPNPPPANRANRRRAGHVDVRGGMESGSYPAGDIAAVEVAVKNNEEPNNVPVDRSERKQRMRAQLQHIWSVAKKVFSVVVVTGLLVASVVVGRAAHQWITHTPRFGAQIIEVSGNSRTLQDDVLTAGGIQVGVNVVGLDLLRAERAIERLPWIKRAHVTRRLPNYVRVEVEERVPAAIVALGALYLCSTDGTLFKRLTNGDPDDLPVITGLRRADFEQDPDGSHENVRDALALLADVASSSLGNRVRVSEVHRDPTGDLSMVLAETGTYVWLGRGQYRAKMSRLSAILAELRRQNLTAAEIHLESDRHPERATVRLPVREQTETTETQQEQPTQRTTPSANGR